MSPCEGEAPGRREFRGKEKKKKNSERKGKCHNRTDDFCAAAVCHSFFFFFFNRCSAGLTAELQPYEVLEAQVLQENSRRSAGFEEEGDIGGELRLQRGEVEIGRLLVERRCVPDGLCQRGGVGGEVEKVEAVKGRAERLETRCVICTNGFRYCSHCLLFDVFFFSAPCFRAFASWPNLQAAIPIVTVLP